MNFKEFKDKVKKAPLFGGDVADLFSARPQAMRNQLLRWRKKGLIVRLRKGLYLLGKEERTTSSSKELIAGSLYRPSYISLETALSYYKLIPERVASITSVTTRKTKTFQNEEGLFTYRHLKKTAYFGFRLARDEYGFPYFLAEQEKALLDYLYLNLGSIKADDPNYFGASLRLQNKASLNKAKLMRYARRYGVKKLVNLAGKIK